MSILPLYLGLFSATPGGLPPHSTATESVSSSSSYSSSASLDPRPPQSTARPCPLATSNASLLLTTAEPGAETWEPPLVLVLAAISLHDDGGWLGV